MRPRMFKLGGAWVWRCEHPAGALVGDQFGESDWRDPWSACLGAVVKHAALYHAEVEEVDFDDLA